MRYAAPLKHSSIAGQHAASKAVVNPALIVQDNLVCREIKMVSPGHLLQLGHVLPYLVSLTPSFCLTSSPLFHILPSFALSSFPFRSDSPLDHCRVSLSPMLRTPAAAPLDTYSVKSSISLIFVPLSTSLRGLSLAGLPSYLSDFSTYCCPNPCPCHSILVVTDCDSCLYKYPLPWPQKRQVIFAFLISFPLACL